MPGHADASPIAEASPEVKSEAGQEMKPCLYSPTTNPSSRTYSGTASSSGGDNIPQSDNFIECSDSHNITKGYDSSKGTPQSRPQRHSSSGMSDAKPSNFSWPPPQTAAGPYGLLSSASSSQNYHANQHNPQTSVPQENFTPFTLSTRSVEPTYPTSVAIDYPNESTHHQQSSPDRMLLNQMTAPNTMPVFGDEGYNRSPFAIPKDFVAYLFSGQQIDNSLPIQIGQQGYAKLVFLSFSDAVS
jgi:hypothetical protein